MGPAELSWACHHNLLSPMTSAHALNHAPHAHANDTPGGMTGLIGAILCGPRIGRFEEGQVKEIPGHDMSSVSIGTFMMWFGWFGFNCGSSYLYLNPGPSTVNRVALNMTLSAATAGITALLAASVKSGQCGAGRGCRGGGRERRTEGAGLGWQGYGPWSYACSTMCMQCTSTRHGAVYYH